MNSAAEKDNPALIGSETYKSYIKSPFRSVKHSTYFETYDALLAPYRGKAITFVEIGIFDGGSLFMWRDYFGPNARIIGIELNPEAKKWEDHGFEIFTGSQSDETFWQKFFAEIGPVDILLDDGGHTYEQQIITTECALPHIKDGGLLVVEDTHTSYMRGFGPRRYSFMAYVKRRLDKINRRYGRLAKRGGAETRIWSVQVFESITAFHINRAASERISTPTENNSNAPQAIDFRHFDNALYQRVTAKSTAKKDGKKALGSGKIARRFWKLVTRLKGASRTRTFFK